MMFFSNTGNLPEVSRRISQFGAVLGSVWHIRNFLFLIGIVVFVGCSSSIHDEVSRGNLDNVKRMLAQHPELLEAKNNMEKTPLFYAVARGREEIVGFLLSLGANPNAQDITGLTPLHVAAWWDKTEQVDQLLAAGAQLEAKDVFGDTPLHVAAIQGRTKMVAYLVEKGAEINAKNADGKTPLVLARQYRKEETAQRLVELGAKEQ